MNSPVRIGVIGIGDMGTHHVENLARHRIPGARLAALMDPDVSRLRQVGAETGVSLLFEESRALTGHPDIDAVLIAAPDHLHAGLVLECLAEGKPVFVEKPLATRTDQAREVVEAEVRHGRRMIQVGFMREYDPAHVAVKQAVDQGKLGARLVFRGVHRSAHHTASRTVADLMVNSMIHDFHSARWMMEDDVVRVFAQVLPDTPQAPGTARLGLVQLQFRQGALGFLECNSAAGYGYEVDVEITCATGTVVSSTVASPVVKQAFTQSLQVPADWHDRFAVAYRLELSAWVQGLSRGQCTGPSAWDGYMSMLMAEACITSACNDEPVAVPVPARPELYA